MSPQADVRASGADILSRTGNPLLLTLTFPADFLDGKTWSAAFGSTSVTPVVVGDVMTLALTGAQTTSLGNGKHTWTLTDTTGDDVVMVSGRLLLGTSSTDSPDTAITVQVSPSVEVAVSVVAAGVDLATVQDLIDDLIGGAPGALDTLNELAAALGDDANFAATVTAALANKQPLDADLTAIAALTTTAYGRGLLTDADAAAFTTRLTSLLNGTFAPVGNYVSTVAAPTGVAATDTAAIQGAIDALPANGGTVRLQRGTYLLNAALVIDSSGVTIQGEGSGNSTANSGTTILKQSSTSANGILIDVAGTIYHTALRGFILQGPGSGSGIGIDAGASTNVKHTLLFDNVKVIDFGSHGLRTAYTDHLTMNGCEFRRNGADGWYGDTATNASTAIGCYFGGTGTDAGIRGVDIDAVVLQGCEFSDADYGIFIKAGGSENWSIIACRWEALVTRQVEIGEGAASYPTRFEFVNCTFLGDSTMTPLVRVNGAAPVEFRKCGFKALPNGGVGVKAVTSTATTKVIVRESAASGTGTNHVFQDNGSTNYSDRLIVFGGDYTDTIPSPFGMFFQVPVSSISASDTITLGMVPRACTIVASYVCADQAIASSATDKWTFTLQRYSSGTLQGTTGSGDTQSRLNTARRFSTLSNGAQLSFSAADVLVLDIVKAGSPAALEDLCVMVQYRPA